MLVRGDKWKTVEERFLDRVLPEPNCGCWLWDGPCYGKPLLRPYFNCDGIRVLAYRTSFLLFKGEIPEGLNVCHTCDVSICVNPDHLYAGTQLQNMLDAIERGRHVTVRHKSLIADLGRSMGRANAGRTKFSDAEIVDIQSRHKSKETITAIAAAYGVQRSTIYRTLGRST